ncbi:MAG: hypothetical protein E6G56_13040 [Actinobacteria bacterium]|nr:MAG: hypothetical protein E6G56_13040 [Actinomycetota bacterium]
MSPTEPEPLTLAEVVRRAVEICDAGARSRDVQDLLARLEDADEPITAVPDIEERMEAEAAAIDPDEPDPALTMARAITVYLAHRRDELDEDGETLLRLAARAEFGGDPPPAVAAWLVEQGVAV